MYFDWVPQIYTFCTSGLRNTEIVCRLAKIHRNVRKRVICHKRDKDRIIVTGITLCAQRCVSLVIPNGMRSIILPFSHNSMILVNSREFHCFHVNYHMFIKEYDVCAFHSISVKIFGFLGILMVLSLRHGEPCLSTRFHVYRHDISPDTFITLNRC